MTESEHILYFDNAATTPIYPESVDILTRTASENFYNPSAVYAQGIKAQEELEAKRKSIASALGVPATDLYFTSGGTEGSNTVIHGVLEATKVKKPKIITTQVEHPAVLEVFKHYEAKGIETVYLPVDAYGRADLKALEEALDDSVVLVSMMAVNNELGSINDLVSAGELIRKLSPQAVFHSDFVQAFMKIDDPRIDIKKAGIDCVNVASHKIHGPKGIGALYVKDRKKVKALLQGGGQEQNFRSGTENLPLIAAFSHSVELRVDRIAQIESHVRRLKERLLNNLSGTPDMVNQCADDASPYIVSLAFGGVKGEVILHMLESEGILISTGSACSSHHQGGHVQKAIGLDPLYSAGTIRISFSEFNTIDEVDRLSEAILAAVQKIRKLTRYKHSKKKKHD